MNQYGSPYDSGLGWVSSGYDFKETPIGSLHAEKLADSDLFYVFRIVFTTSLFT